MRVNASAELLVQVRLRTHAVPVLISAYSDAERQLLKGSPPATAHLGIRAMAACNGLNFTP